MFQPSKLIEVFTSTKTGPFTKTDKGKASGEDGQQFRLFNLDID
jgi:hypothetical protein